MRDLAIWRRLQDGTATAADLAAIAALPLVRRAAYAGGARSLATHADPAIRTAALRALAGARGVEGVRAIVAALDDEAAEVRLAAVEALREVARDAPVRYAHALFHARADVRIAALSIELPTALAELAIYLRADPACRDLARQKARWPEKSLALAFALRADGHIYETELVDHVLNHTPGELRDFLLHARRRTPETIAKYIGDALYAPEIPPPPGTDMFDTLVESLSTIAAEGRPLDHLVDTLSGPKNRSLAQRAVVSLLRELRGTSFAPLWAVTAVLDPRVIGFPSFPASRADVAAAALFRYKWPVRPAQSWIERLLHSPVVERDLPLAAAVAGLATSRRLRALATALGEQTIVDALVRDSRGWAEICLLPAESPALELEWLQRVQAIDYQRYVELAGIAMRAFTGARLGMFVEQMPRRHRPAVFLAALLGERGSTTDRVLALCKVVAARVDRQTLSALVAALLDDPDGGRVVLGLVRHASDKLVAGVAADLSVVHVRRLVGVLETDPVPRDRELALARVFRERRIPEAQAWCDEVESIVTAPVLLTATVARVQRELTTAERDRIATCSDANLRAALAPALGSSVSGLCPALDRRAARPDVWACAALLACSDPLEDVARVLDRFAELTPAFEAALDDAMGIMARATDLPLLAQARLWRWEQQQFRLLEWMEASGGALPALQLTDTLRGSLARRTLWQGISEALMLVRYRAMPRFRVHASLELAQFCAEHVDRDIGRHAARIVVALVESGIVPVSAVRDLVLDRIADADTETRSYAARLVRLEGVPIAQASEGPPPMPLVEQIRNTRDLDTLAAWCRDPRTSIVQEAALVLVAQGARGQRRLSELLVAREPLVPQPILATIVLWDDDAAVDRIRALADAPDLGPAWQFYLALALVQRGEPRLDQVFAAVRTPADDWYFRRADWEALVRVADRVTCCIALADSPHHHAYQPAVQTLLSLTRPTPEVQAALVRFLEVDSNRPLQLRFSATRFLARHFGDGTGEPLLVEQLCDETSGETNDACHSVPPTLRDRVLRAVVDAALIGGPPVCAEKRLWFVVTTMRANRMTSADVAAEIDLSILEHAQSAAIRRNAAAHVLENAEKQHRVRRVAEVFAWGIRRGVELTGRLYKIHLTSKEADLGHTRLDTNRIFVSPLPMLRGEPHGQDVVEGLVLHEIGHHVYHRGAEAQALWKQAHAEGIGHFLNLIADEHLERNLRGIDATYGDRLKRLGAYAFQHAPQELKLATLCESLGASTAAALIAADIEVAFDEASVRLRRGAILGELDRAGHPVARFARALRMGLGNRSGDPLLAQALALCGKDLKTLDMRGLYDLTRALVDLFGGRIEIAKVFGGPEGLAFGERDDDVFGAGVDDDVLQKEIERVLEPGRSSRGGKGTGDRLQINVNPDTTFDKITHITRVRGNPDAHRALASDVKRHSARLARYLDDLGLRWHPVRARTQGRALDKTRLRALVTRNDPRILMARTPVRKTDLFLGTIVDCSGSMTARNNIDRARRFAVLVAESVRELAGVDARFFGFTDSQIYDAGDKDDCNVVALEASGGNNDAAALYHAANVALASRKAAKVLVMISDGLPTQCSTAALRNLVTELTRRRGIICAQVAVIPLQEICFPHHVLIDDDRLDVAVAKFGRMIADLARRSLGA